MVADMIEGAKVRLRPIEKNDLALLRQWANDAKLMRFWSNPKPIVTGRHFEDDLNVRFATFDYAGYFMIEDPERNAIGRIEFERLSVRERSAEVMILIDDEQARGQCFGSDAMVALLRYLFHQRDLHRVWLTVLAWNQPAIRSYEKVGFVREGVLRQDVYFEGVAHDQLVMAMLRPEFDAKWAATPVETAP
jgi:ribosomal-protein-alanine N-acetyltransferase